MDEFTQAYIEAALFSSVDDDGKPLDASCTSEDLDTADKLRMMVDCADFQKRYADDISDNPLQAGHDFWFTRNGHGAGFWDGDWPEDAGERLTEASKAFGECTLLLNNNGTVEALWG